MSESVIVSSDLIREADHRSSDCSRARAPGKRRGCFWVTSCPRIFSANTARPESHQLFFPLAISTPPLELPLLRGEDRGENVKNSDGSQYALEHTSHSVTARQIHRGSGYAKIPPQRHRMPRLLSKDERNFNKSISLQSPDAGRTDVPMTLLWSEENDECVCRRAQENVLDIGDHCLASGAVGAMPGLVLPLRVWLLARVE
ncbi:unnamed protein product [Pleuronectes platessa]|uniref:Uncharacterized protein n=1 Tax=Pleuronectes platessa TaxID=8262 RepID=A0A9N7TSF1_PLEPL|nr:unnamed protein product [Pleuronectes platessa]